MHCTPSDCLSVCLMHVPKLADTIVPVCHLTGPAAAPTGSQQQASCASLSTFVRESHHHISR